MENRFFPHYKKIILLVLPNMRIPDKRESKRKGTKVKKKETVVLELMKLCGKINTFHQPHVVKFRQRPVYWPVFSGHSGR